MTELTLEELAELDRLSVEVARCQAIADAGNDGFYMQVTYAEEDLGRAMVKHQEALLAMARELIRLRDALEFLGGVGCPIQGRSVEQVFDLADSLGWSDPTTPKAGATGEGGEK